VPLPNGWRDRNGSDFQRGQDAKDGPEALPNLKVLRHALARHRGNTLDDRQVWRHLADTGGKSCTIPDLPENTKRFRFAAKYVVLIMHLVAVGVRKTDAYTTSMYMGRFPLHGTRSKRRSALRARMICWPEQMTWRGAGIKPEPDQNATFGAIGHRPRR
jgi:hypothetical protein